MKIRNYFLKSITACLLSATMIISATPQVYANIGYIEPDVEIIKEDEKDNLSELASYLETAVEGEDYVQDVVFKLTDERDDVDAIIDAYNAELISYENDVAVFKLPEDISVLEAITLAADSENNYPVVYPNLYSKSNMVSASQDLSIDYEANSNSTESNDAVTSGLSNINDEVTINSVLSDMFDPYVNENASQGTYNSYQWHHEVIGSQYAWANDIKGRNVNVAIIANGISTSHTDMTANIIASRTYAGGTSVTDSSNIDESGYGTAVAGLIAASQNNQLGMGIAPDVNIVNIKTDGDIASLCAAIQFLANNGVPIIALTDSFDMPIESLELALNYAYENGCAVFAPVGNTGGSFEVYPAAYESVICVGATNKCNQRAGMYSYNSSIDISVPGTELWTCDSTNDSLYSGFEGNVLISGIAAGEAALIIGESYKKTVPALLDKDGNLLVGYKRVDALLKLMKASTIKAGEGTGSGIVYIPKALGLNSSMGVPASPVIKFEPVTSLNAKISIEADAFTSYIYYTVNGKKPTFKNGIISSDSRVIYGNVSTSEIVDTSNITTDKLVINAIAVNPLGIASKVATCNIPLTGYADSVSVSGASNLLAGKSTTMKATVIPSNSKTKNVKWHVAFGSDENKAKENGVTIGANGALKAAKTAVSGTYYVWAETVVSGKISPMYAVYVKQTQNIKSIKPTASKVTESIGYSSISRDLASLFQIQKMDGTLGTPSDVEYASSDVSIAEVVSGDLVIKKSGVVTVTATAKDGSGISAKCTLNVLQKVTGIFFNSNGYDKVAKGKSIKLDAFIVPANSVVRKITKWSVDSVGEANGIKVSNGKVSADKNTTPGLYTVTAQVTDIDGTVMSSTYSVEVIAEEITKITVPKTITVFRMENNFEAKDFTELHVKVDGGEKDSYGSNAYGAVKVTYADNGLLNTTYGSLVPENGGYVIPVKASGLVTGKTKLTFEAMDGSGKKAACTVNVVNPASTVKVAPASAEVSDLTAGKSTTFKAVIGTEYGAVSDKKVEWSILDGETFAQISQAGALKVEANTPNYTYIRVRAKAKDGSGAYGDYGMRVFKDPGKLEITNASGTKINPPKEVSEMYYQDFYIKVPKKDEPYEKIIDGHCYGDFKLSSSDPLNATIRRNKAVPVKTIPGYYLYYFQALGVKKGSSKLTVTTPDGSQSVTINLKVVD